MPITRREANRTAPPHPRVVAPRRGWPAPAAGRAAHVEHGSVYLGTTAQVAGLFPFVQAAGLPAQGVPIGSDLLTRQLVCLDPPGWVGSLVSNPTVWVSGQPGVGKSAIVKRLCLGLVGYGYGMLCPGDPKGEYVPLVQALGGQVVRVGRGLDRINPLDSGPLGRHLDSCPPARREQLLVEINARRTELLHALAATSYGLGRRPGAEESAALSAAVPIAAAGCYPYDPVIADVIRVLRNPPAPLLARLLRVDEPGFFDGVRPLVSALESLCSGALAGLFDAATSTPLDLDARAVTVDLSALLGAGDQVVAAGLLACWAYAYQAVDLARALGVAVRPRILPVDELWRALRAGPGMVDAFDALTRFNRAKGEITVLVTHSIRDLDALPTPEDRAKAGGLMERCDTVILAAQPAGELERFSRQKPLTGPERELVASWAAPAGTGIDGTTAVHPGRGKYLIKLGQRLGVPTQMLLHPLEARLFDTDQAIRARTRSIP